MTQLKAVVLLCDYYISRLALPVEAGGSRPISLGARAMHLSILSHRYLLHLSGSDNGFFLKDFKLLKEKRNFFIVFCF
jgi:hypothetical protein